MLTDSLIRADISGMLVDDTGQHADDQHDPVRQPSQAGRLAGRR
jgi:hypothetical protein